MHMTGAHFFRLFPVLTVKCHVLAEDSQGRASWACQIPELPLPGRCEQDLQQAHRLGRERAL